VVVLCDQRDHLFTLYNECTNRWVYAVRRLADHAGICEDDYLSLICAVEEAKALTADAKATYAKHIEVHKCARPSSTVAPMF